MEHITLGGTELTVSRIGCGTMTFGTQVDAACARTMVDLCRDHEINFFDTANVYGAGAAETILGSALQGCRTDVVLASKVGGKYLTRSGRLGRGGSAGVVGQRPWAESVRGPLNGGGKKW